MARLSLLCHFTESLFFIVIYVEVSLAVSVSADKQVAQAARHAASPSEPKRSFSKDGDISIAAYFPMFTPNNQAEGYVCRNGRRSLSSKMFLAFAEPFLFMLRRKNFSLTAVARDGSATIERRLRLGFEIFDQCEEGDGGLVEAAAVFQTIVRERQGFCKRDRASKPPTSHSGSPRIMAVVGPSIEEEKVAVTSVVSSANQLVQIATRSTREQFSCDGQNDCSTDFEYLFRASSSDRFQAFAIADLIRHFRWTHFAVVAAKDITSMALLGMFRQRIAEYGFCPAFVTTFDTYTDHDAVNIDRLLRQNIQAKVLVVLAGEKHVRFLADTIIRRSNDLRKDLPLIWIGNDKWGSVRDLVFTEDGETYRRTMKAVLGVDKRTPTRFDGWEWPLTKQSYIKDYSEYIRNLTAADVRQNRLITSNPYLCHVMEKVHQCTGVCSSSDWGNATVPRCADHLTIPQKAGTGPATISELTEPFTMVATDIILRAMEGLFQEFVTSSPLLSGDRLAGEFYTHAYGGRLRRAVKDAKLPCGNGTKMCAVFPDNLQEFLPEYHIIAVDMKLKKSLWIGFWKVENSPNGNVNYSRTALKLDKSHVSFGHELFHDQNISLPFDLYYSADQASPTSSCFRTCGPGYQRIASLPTCCHQCQLCQEGWHSPTGLGLCMPCKPGYTSSTDRSKCVRLPRIAARDSLWSGVIAGSVTMVTILVATLSVLVYFRKTMFVRSSDVALTTTLLLVMITGFLGLGAHILHPTTFACTAQQLTGTLSLLSTTIIILVKTSRFARILSLSAGYQRTHLKWTMSTSAQYVFAFLLLLVGLLVESVSITLSPTTSEEVFTQEATYAVCRSPPWLTITTDAYLILLILITVTLAFFTRKLPVSYNEAHLLFLTAFSQCVLWGLLRPMYYLSKPYNRQLPEVLLVTMHMTTIWLWLFVPRLYALLFRKHRLDRQGSNVTWATQSVRTSVAGANSLVTFPSVGLLARKSVSYAQSTGLVICSSPPSQRHSEFPAQLTPMRLEALVE